MKRAIGAFLILAGLSATESPAEELDFRPYVHGEIRKSSYTFFCLMETGGRHIVETISRFMAGEISNEEAGEEIRKKVIVYRCNRQHLTHMSTKTLIRGKIPGVEAVDGRLYRITKDSSLVQAQAKDGLIIYVVTNAPVPPPEGEKPEKSEKPPEAAKKSHTEKSPEAAGENPEEKESAKKGPEESEGRPEEVKDDLAKTGARGEGVDDPGAKNEAPPDAAEKSVEPTQEEPERESDAPEEEDIAHAD
ncbi:hypothetical protein ACFLQ0_01035 [Nitrospinota bacterium]